MAAEILQGDVIEVLRGYADESMAACLCDPPYGLQFMAKNWDHGVPGVAYWAEVLRVMKPGGVLMAFGGTRTHHRLMVAIEDAGFEIFDTMMWLYGSGFPKSHDISKAIDKAAGAEREVVGQYESPEQTTGWKGQDSRACYSGPSQHKDGEPRLLTSPATPDAATWQGYGTALKPAWEPIVLARKPRKDTYAATALEHGSGALNIEGSRIGIGENDGEAWRKGSYETQGAYFGGSTGKPYRKDKPNGRWPANLMISHSPGCVRRGERRVKSQAPIYRRDAADAEADDGLIYGKMEPQPADKQIGYADADGLETVADFLCEPDCPVRLLGEQSGERGSYLTRNIDRPIEESNPHGIYGSDKRARTITTYADTGTAARFFANFDPPLRFRYSAKAGRTERDAGLDGMPLQNVSTLGEYVSPSEGRTARKAGGEPRRNTNPCVKPLAVTRYLATLLRPPDAYLDDATILIPFCGVASEMIGALLAGWRNVVGIELEQEYVAIAEARLEWWAKAMALTHETEPNAILAEMKGRDIDDPVQAPMFNEPLT